MPSVTETSTSPLGKQGEMLFFLAFWGTKLAGQIRCHFRALRDLQYMQGLIDLAQEPEDAPDLKARAAWTNGEWE